MRIQKSFGVIPIRQTGRGRRFLLVKHRKGHWGFPKGKPDAGETAMQTARRELAEETGITRIRLARPRTLKFKEAYPFKRKGRATTLKKVTYFVGYVESESVTIMPGELRDYAWGSAAKTLARLTYPESRAMFQAVLDQLPARKRR